MAPLNGNTALQIWKSVSGNKGKQSRVPYNGKGPYDSAEAEKKR